MKDGFIKVSAVTLDIKIADIDYNVAQIVSAIKSELKKHTKICVFPRLAITGATCGDLFYQKALIRKAEEGLDKIVEVTKGHDTLCFIGYPFYMDGKTVDSVAVVQDGRILDIEPLEDPSGIYVCENLPGLVVSIGKQTGAASIVAVPCADPVIQGSNRAVDALIKSESLNNHCGIIRADAGPGESTTDDVFGGHNVIAENGEILAVSQSFETGALTSEIDIDRLISERKTDCFSSDTEPKDVIPFFLKVEETELTRKYKGYVFLPDEEHAAEDCTFIHELQARGLMKRLQHTGVRKAVIGISGGLDSTNALLVCMKAFDNLGIPRENIIAVTMPCFGTSDRTYRNACAMIKSTGCTFREINIEKSVSLHLKDIGHDPKIHNAAYENAQARERTQVLMDISNDENALVVGTGDLSELALGWATYNGDHMSNYSVNASVSKTLIRELVVRYCSRCEDKKLKKTLMDVVYTPISPELLPAVDDSISQKTEDIVGPYELHDFFLYYMVRFGFEPKKIFRLAVNAWGKEYDKETILNWLEVFTRRFFSQQFKRNCMPDGPYVGPVDLSPRGHFMMPSDACSTLWVEQIRELKQVVSTAAKKKRK